MGDAGNSKYDIQGAYSFCPIARGRIVTALKNYSKFAHLCIDIGLSHVTCIANTSLETYFMKWLLTE